MTLTTGHCTAFHVIRYLQMVIASQSYYRCQWTDMDPGSTSHGNPHIAFSGCVQILGPLGPLGPGTAVEKLQTADQRVDIERAASSVDVEEEQTDPAPSLSPLTRRPGQALWIVCHIFFLKSS
ncbi:hypothetical protein E6O75_ATG11034 [Venturia nashicola]|uniref:Uncharacterized protein n=1 Tax=Venturia nashicola TaxID=86259 RepID=A0A4Z1PGS1_9PEZI|nr:hypothetical protein E6O75_ATG11034 [Venturia nashicola]